MKLRPTKSDRKVLDKLKKITGCSTYTKAIMAAAECYPDQLAVIADQQAELDQLHAKIRQFEQASGYVLDGLEALKRLRSEQSD